MFVSVSPSFVTTVYCGKMADSIEMPFGVVGPVDLRNDVLDEGSNSPAGKGSFWGCDGAM